MNATQMTITYEYTGYVDAQVRISLPGSNYPEVRVDLYIERFGQRSDPQAKIGWYSASDMSLADAAGRVAAYGMAITIAANPQAAWDEAVRQYGIRRAAIEAARVAEA